jgi:RNA polymerase sigma-70 factor (ECF subfamily)
VPTDDEFEDFYEAAYGRLVGQLTLILGDRAEAEDVVQEAMLRALQRWSRIRRYEVPEAWVRRVALNLAVNRFRRARRKLAMLAKLLPDTATTELDDEQLQLDEALAKLPLRYRRVLVLCYVAGLTVDEAAAELHLPRNTVKTQLARGRSALAAQLSVPEEEVERHVR